MHQEVLSSSNGGGGGYVFGLRSHHPYTSLALQDSTLRTAQAQTLCEQQRLKRRKHIGLASRCMRGDVAVLNSQESCIVWWRD